MSASNVGTFAASCGFNQSTSFQPWLAVGREWAIGFNVSLLLA